MEPTPAGTRGPLDATTAPGPVDSARPDRPGRPRPVRQRSGRPRRADDRVRRRRRRRRRRPHGKRRKAPWLVAVEWVVLIVGALVIALLIKTFLFQAFYIPSESMVPTLQIGDRVLVNKLCYDLHDVNRGDIVVFEATRRARHAGDRRPREARRSGCRARRSRAVTADRLHRRRAARRELPAGRDARDRATSPPTHGARPTPCSCMGDNRGQLRRTRAIFGRDQGRHRRPRLRPHLAALDRLGFM